MTLAAGAWLAAIAGCTTGGIEAYLRCLPSRPARKSIIGFCLLGALIATMAYGVFLFAGFAVSLMMFSSAPDPGPALLCVIIGCAAFLLIRGLQHVLAPRFGLPEPADPSKGRNLWDVLEAHPRGGRPTMWLGGVGFALLPVLYGIRCIVTRKGELGTLIWPSAVDGGAATALGLGWIGVGLFLHFHFFFGLHPGLQAYSRRGKSLSLIVACVGLTVAGAWSVIAKVPP